MTCCTADHEDKNRICKKADLQVHNENLGRTKLVWKNHGYDQERSGLVLSFCLKAFPIKIMILVDKKTAWDQNKDKNNFL